MSINTVITDEGLRKLTETHYPQGEDILAFIRRTAPIIAKHPKYPRCDCGQTHIWESYNWGIACPNCGQKAYNLEN